MKSHNFKKAVMMAAVGGMLFSSAIYSEARMHYPPSKDYQYQFKSVRNNYADTEAFKAFSRQGEIPETEFLSHLDKEGRSMYQGLDKDNRKLARELAAQSSNRGVLGTERELRQAVETAAEHVAEQRIKLQDRRLHNGMDR